MIVKSFTGRTVPEALEKVRAGLGSRALIIETRPLQESGLFGRRTGFEVVAASDDEPEDAVPVADTFRRLEVIDGTRNKPAAGASTSTGQAAGLLRSEPVNPGLDDELAAIRRQLARLAAGNRTPVDHLGEELAGILEEAELPGELTAELDAACAAAGERLPPERRGEFCAAVLTKALPGCATMDWDGCRRLMLVGPTGVGKTTTIAKLAGDLVLKRKRSVALLTIDTYRVGAQDQLKAYADLLDIPFAVASTPAHFAEELRRLERVDHVLIDTAGRSPADAVRVHELKGFCRAAAGIQVCLALGANAGRAEFSAVVERFSLLPIEHAVLTKFDECAAAGRLYGCLRRHRLPVRWITTGQEVPADIQPASAQAIAARVVAGNPVATASASPFAAPYAAPFADSVA